MDLLICDDATERADAGFNGRKGGQRAVPFRPPAEVAARVLVEQRLTHKSPYSRRAAEFSTTMTLRGVHAEA
jgi:hypothetical protein